jgi:two-component system LytT family sensor kinase
MLYIRKFFRWHLLLWVAYFGYLVLGDYQHKRYSQQDIWLDVSFWASCLVTFYFCYLLVFPRLLRVGRLPLLALGLLAAGVLFAGVRTALEEGLYPLVLGFRNHTPDTTLYTYLFDGFYYTLPDALLAGVLWATETALRRERENQQLTTDKRAAELAFLKAQINPHFLYNTLNMLYGLAYGVDKTLAGGLLKLSELMRYMLRDSPDGLVDLSQEVEYIHHFLDLYRLRYPGRLYAELLVTGTLEGHRVAPLLLIPFVENAFKHGVLDDPATPVRMHLTILPDAIEFTVENQQHDYQPDHSSGIGLTNLHRRLELLYPGRYTWQVGPAGTVFRACLRLEQGLGAPGRVEVHPPIVASAHGQ